MPRVNVVKVRVTKNQLERIQMNAQAKGFRTISDYIRHLSLEHSTSIEKKIVETNKMMKDVLEIMKEGQF